MTGIPKQTYQERVHNWRLLRLQLTIDINRLLMIAVPSSSTYDQSSHICPYQSVYPCRIYQAIAICLYPNILDLQVYPFSFIYMYSWLLAAHCDQHCKEATATFVHMMPKSLQQTCGRAMVDVLSAYVYTVLTQSLRLLGPKLNVFGLTFQHRLHDGLTLAWKLCENDTIWVVVWERSGQGRGTGNG